MNTCAQCGSTLPPHNGRGRPAKYCDKTCSRKAQKAAAKTRPGKPCTIDGCDKRLVARGLCSTHYNRKYCPDRWKTKTVACAYCGTLTTSSGGGGRKFGAVCSTLCRRGLQTLSRSGAQSSASRDLVPVPPSPRNPLADRRPRPTRSTRKRWFAGNCVVCGDKFVSETTARTCSEPCAEQRFMDQRRAGKHARRARMKAAFVSHVSPLAIYKRDGWQCWLCLSPIDPDADPQGDDGPSLDHVIPLANGGTHEPSNVRACHRGCNARRSNHPTLTSSEGMKVAVLF